MEGIINIGAEVLGSKFIEIRAQIFQKKQNNLFPYN